MELLQLRYFLTVAKMLNISRAAQYHMIPQPAMSQTISRLEKELGKSLFDRHKNRLTLTPEGQDFFHSVTASLEKLDTAVRSIHCDNGALQGELTLLVQQHRGTIVDCIAEFRKIYPDVSFRIFYTQDRNTPDDFDFCVSCTPPGPTYSDGKCLVSETLRLMVSASHPLATKALVHFEELKEEAFAFLDMHNSLWHHTLHLCHEAGFEPKISMVCADLHCMIKYIAAGMAVTMCPEISWWDIQNDALTFVPTMPQETRSTYVFSNRLKSPSKLRETFLNFLVEYFTQLQLHHQSGCMCPLSQLR